MYNSNNELYKLDGNNGNWNDCYDSNNCKHSISNIEPLTIENVRIHNELHSTTCNSYSNSNEVSISDSFDYSIGSINHIDIINSNNNGYIDNNCNYGSYNYDSVSTHPSLCTNSSITWSTESTSPFPSDCDSNDSFNTHVHSFHASQYINALYRGNQWPEQTTNTEHYSSHWKLRAWTFSKPQKHHEITLFADTGASISACNSDFARKHYHTFIKKRKSPLRVRVANGHSVSLNEYIHLPIYDQSGKYRFSHEFYLFPGLKRDFLASFYLLQRLQFRFPRDAPLLTKNIKLQLTDYVHHEEYDENFGNCNNWDEPRLKSRVYQKDYSNNPNFQKYTNSIQFDDRIIDATIYEYEILHKLTNFDFTRYKPQSVVTDPYNNKLKSYNINNYTTFKTTDLSTVHSITIDGNHIPQHYVDIKDNFCHISNYKASPEELRKAEKLSDARQFNKVNLEHVKHISQLLYDKTTKLLYHTLDSLFAKHQSHTKPIPKYEFKIDLIENAPDKIFIKQYHLSEEKRLVVIHHTNQNIKNGVFIADNKSPHNVPIIVIPKKPNRFRPAYALQHLNKYTKTVPSHIPTYDYIFEILRGPGLFSTTDLKNFFECINLRKKDQPLAHVTTPLGGFNLTRGTYGFKNIMSLAQDIGNYLVRPFHNTVAFVDDVIRKHDINATPDQLYDDIYELFTRAYEIGLLIHPEKTYLFCEEVEYLGYIFNQLGVIPRPEYIQKVLQFHEPKTKKQIQQYLAVLNYIARFLPDLAKYTQVLNKLTHKTNTETWSDEHQQAFDHIQHLVQTVPLLAHPTEDGQFLVQTDASKYAMAAVLYQRQYNKETNEHDWKIIEFYSKQFDQQLVDHPIMVKECLAITYALNHWQHFLLRRKFLVDTDHRNLISLYDSDEMKAANMKKKQMFVTMRNAISHFHFRIAHLKGEQIPLPDYLTRDGSIAQRTAPIAERTAKLTNTKLVSPQYTNNKEKELLYLTLKYKNYINDNNIQFPPTTKQFHELNNIEFEHQCSINEMKYIDEHDLLKIELIEDCNRFTQHQSPNNIEPLNRWLCEPETNNNTTTCYGTTNTIQQFETIHEINCINAIENNNSHKKCVTFDLIPKYTKSITHHNYPKLKPILKRNKYNKYRPWTKRYIPSKCRHTELLYDKNKNYFDNWINDAIETAFINRFSNQYNNIDINNISISTKQIHAIQELFSITSIKNNTNIITESPTHGIYSIENDSNNSNSNNYYTDNQGRRRSQRIKKPPKRFYEAYSHENSETIKAREKYNNNNSDNNDFDFNLSKKQKQRQQKENKFKLSPNQTHTLFQSLYNDIYRSDQLDSLLSPIKLRINQNNDPIAQLIIDHLNNNTSKNDKRYKLLQQHYGKLYKMLFEDMFIINSNDILCVKPTNIYDTERIYVPTNLISTALQYTHKTTNFQHPGEIQTQQLIKQKFYWYKWQSDSRKYVSQCEQCQEAKGHKFHKRGELAPVISHKFNDIIHIDFMGPFHGSLNVLIITDNFTGYTMLIDTFGQTADDVILAIWNKWKPINGIPCNCLSDRGKGFISELNQRFYKMFGIKGLFTSGYHAQTNAKAERRVQEAKKAIRLVNTTLNGELTHKNNKKNAVNSIKLLLPSIQFSLNQKPFTFSGLSPNMLTRGQNLNDTIDVTASLKTLAETSKMKKFKDSHQVLNMLKNSLTTIRSIFNQHRWFYIATTLEKYNRHQKQDNFKIDDLVMYYVGERQYPMKTIRPRFTGPFRIIKRINHNTVTIYNEDSNESMTCHTNKLKLFNKNTFMPEHIYLRQLRDIQKLNKSIRRNRKHTLNLPKPTLKP